MYLRRTASGAAGNGLGTTIKYLRRRTDGAAGNSLGTTAKYPRGAAGIGLGSTARYLRRATSGAADNGLGTAIEYVRRTTSYAGPLRMCKSYPAEIRVVLNYFCISKPWIMNTASKLGPHTQTDRGTCPGVGL
jgi:hypothetical protein